MLVFTLVFSAMLCGVRGTQSARSLRHLEMAGRTRLAAHSQETGLEVVIVRPPLVYGPGLKGNFISLLAAIDRGIPLPLAGANNVRSLVYMGNLADALIACATHPAAAGQTYLVSDGDDVSTAMLVEKIARALGCNSRAFYFPPALLGAMAAALGRARSRLIDCSVRCASMMKRYEENWPGFRHISWSKACAPRQSGIVAGIFADCAGDFTSEKMLAVRSECGSGSCG